MMDWGIVLAALITAVGGAMTTLMTESLQALVAAVLGVWILLQVGKLLFPFGPLDRVPNTLNSVTGMILLSIGILFVGRWLSVVLVTSLVAAYWLISLSITPYLRHAYHQRMRLEAESTNILLETSNISILIFW
jgi:hypothetical protein